MIPISLTLNGIYSYKTQQTIDFEHLTKNHLFGIFGPVGSGKSTILEAISYALYGETERLNSKDSRNYNMMNLKSDSLFIDYIFKSGKKNTETFRFSVKGKRDKKNFEIVKTLDRKAYKQEGESWIPIDCEDVERIIGLSYDNFRRTIIIPQGKFQEFLQLGEADRTRMMMEIFNLDRYDLAKKTDIVDKQNLALLEGVKGQLLEIGVIDQDMIDKVSVQKNALEKQRLNLAKELDYSEKSEKNMQDTKMFLIKVENQNKELKELENLAPQYQKREKLVDQYEICQKNFPDILKRQNELTRLIAEADKSIVTKRKSIEKLSERLERDQKEYEHLKPEYEQRHKLETKWKELESIESVLQLTKDNESLETKRAKLVGDISDKKEKIEKNKTTLKDTENDLKQFKKQLPDEKKLLEIKMWFDKHSSMRDRIDELSQDIAETNDELNKLENEKKELLSDSRIILLTTNAERKMPLDELVAVLRKSVKECKASITQIQTEIDFLKRTEVLETFAGDLKEGEPCPLCGAEHHPHKYAGKGVKTKVETLQKEKKKIEKDIDHIQDIIPQLTRLNTELANTRINQDKFLREMNSKKVALGKHKEAFVWAGYVPEDQKRIDNELKLADELKVKILNLDQNREKSQKTIDMTNGLLAELKDELQDLNGKMSEINGERKTLLSQIKHYEISKLDKWNSRSLKQDIFNLKSLFADLEKRYQELDEILRIKKEEQSNLSASIKSEENSLDLFTQQLSTVNKELKERLSATGIKDIKIVSEILGAKINVKTEKDVIRQYYEKLSSAKDHLVKLVTELGDRKYDENKHHELKLRIDSLKGEIKITDEEIGHLSKQIKDLIKNLKKRNGLENQKQKLELKATNLQVLKKLFRGGGFVNYASRIYLENLCGIANRRFTQLTRQKLKLELRDDNSFQIRDFLNDGKVRNVKTLSGGQTFQASLSLALALSDNLQQFVNTEENFFFLDEGFGTLDKESLQIVFDALKSLRHENRVVGVISHVEELQQEIDHFVKIELDSNLGSIISFS